MSLASLFGGGDMSMSTMLRWVLFMGFFMFVMPKLYIYQIFSKIDVAAKKLEKLSAESQQYFINKTAKFGDSKKNKGMLDHFIDFFMIPPVNLDPYGIMKKLEHLIDQTEDRFKGVAKGLVPRADSEKTMDFYMGLQATVMIDTLARIVRHFVEMAKKFKNLQFAMIIQMQLPLIEEMVKSERNGQAAFLNGKPIGDAIGPLVIASMLSKDGKEVAKNVLSGTDTRWGRKVTFLKAKGPGGRLGKIGEAVRIVCEKNKIAKIITVDAAAKLEGEKTGKVADGVGAAIGGAGVQRAKIEDVATKKNIPLSAVAIKMGQFEAIDYMYEEVVDALDPAKERIREEIECVPKGKHVLLVGVGNTCGIPNNNKNLDVIIKNIKETAKKQKAKKEAEKKGWFKRKGVTASIFDIFYGSRMKTDSFKNFDKDLSQGLRINSTING